ncbi:MAG: thioredoxin family protein [Cyanobacteria bacterium K_Offshore_0m_m2_072]|nr:thioredoxin family protein [Cyanobacteria bacterium K_Offshore_0m_m2_072]
MALTPSSMLPLGTPLPTGLLHEELEGGSLQQVSGEPLQLETLEGLGGKPLLVLFICAHCPYVKHIEPEISRLAADVAAQLQILAISSNSTTTHPQDGPEGLRDQAERLGWRFPYLLDQSQAVARAFAAACTPDPYLFGWDAGQGRHTLTYRGQLDGSRPGNSVPLDGSDIRAALEAVLAGRQPTAEQIPSIGCNIKWHP